MLTEMQRNKQMAEQLKQKIIKIRYNFVCIAICIAFWLDIFFRFTVKSRYYATHWDRGKVA